MVLSASVVWDKHWVMSKVDDMHDFDMKVSKIIFNMISMWTSEGFDKR